MKRRYMWAVPILQAAGQALASGTITSGNASLTLADPFQSGVSNTTFLTDPAAPNQLLGLAWLYRTEANPQNTMFSSINTPAQSFLGNSATFTWTNAGPGAVGVARFDATLTVVLEDGPTTDSARVTQTMVFTASAANTATRTFQVFNFMNLMVGGTVGPDTVAMTSIPARVATYTEPATSSNYGTAQGLNATSYQVAIGSQLFGQITTGSSNLTNAAGPITSGLVANAFQWSMTLAPGQSQTIVSKFTINQPLPETSCYANCDGSTVAPVLNANDFSCFLNRFASGDSYANCDGSTVSPILNANDFSCFLNSFASGCS